MVNGQKKGKNGEQKIVHLLNAHFQTEEFARVPSSGAIYTLHKGKLSEEANKTLAGDIICPKDFIFSIEVKTGYDIDLINLLANSKSTDLKLFKEFCKQASGNTKTNKTIPLLIYQKNRRDILCFIPKVGHLREKKLEKYLRSKKSRYIELNMDEKWIGMPFDDLLNGFNKEFFFHGQKDIIL